MNTAFCKFRKQKYFAKKCAAAILHTSILAKLRFPNCRHPKLSTICIPSIIVSQKFNIFCPGWKDELEIRIPTRSEISIDA